MQTVQQFTVYVTDILILLQNYVQNIEGRRNQTRTGENYSKILVFRKLNKYKLVSMYVIHCGLHYLVSVTYSSVG